MPSAAKLVAFFVYLQKQAFMDENTTQQKILNSLQQKYACKLQVYDQARELFAKLKRTVKQIAMQYNVLLEEADERLQLQFHDRGDFECELKVGGELLIFNMHSNVFMFEPDSFIGKHSYVQDNELNGLCAVFSIYNFIADSIKYNRSEDLGYLIGRVFVNRDYHFFVEGKRQLGFLFNSFANDTIDDEKIKDIVEAAMLYALNFDLYVPNYDDVKITSVALIQDRINHSLVRTGKRIGFAFPSELD